MRIVQNADKTAAALLLGQGDRPIVLGGDVGAARRNALTAAGVPVKSVHSAQYQALRDWADGK